MPNFSAVSHTITPRSLIWVGRALLITLGIVGFSNLIFYPSSGATSGADFDRDFDSNFAANILDVPDTAAEVALSVTWPKQSMALSYGSQADLFRFALEAEGPYTLRYLTFHMKTQGLNLGEEWTLYEVRDGQVDFSHSVGESERVVDLGEEGQTVRLRLFSSKAAGFLGKEGKMEFVVVGRVLREPTTDEANFTDGAVVADGEAAPTAGEPVLMEIWFPTELSPELHWAWLPGEHAEAWITVQESLSLEALAKLPEQGIKKN